MDDEHLAEVGLRFAVEGPVATLTLHRPEAHNAQTPAMWRAMAEVGAAIPRDVRVVVVAGAGPSFSAGVDRTMLELTRPAEGEESLAALVGLGREDFGARVEEFQRGFTWLRDPRFISIAAVQGYAIGAGFQLALSCDLRVIADDAQLCMKETSLGLVPDLTGTKPLVESVGYARALEICVTGRMVGATEAARIGLAAAVVTASRLDAAVTELTGSLLVAPAGAVRDTKALLLGAVDRSLDEQRLAEREAQHGRLGELARQLSPG